MPFPWTQAPRGPGVPACLEPAGRPGVPVESATPLEMQRRLWRGGHAHEAAATPLAMPPRP